MPPAGKMERGNLKNITGWRNVSEGESPCRAIMRTEIDISILTQQAQERVETGGLLGLDNF